MLRIGIAFLFLILYLVPVPVNAEYFPGCPTLGRINVQQAINYFKALGPPRLWTNWHDAANKAELNAKSTSSNPTLASAWAGVAEHGKIYRIGSQPATASFYYNLKGMGSSEKAEFIKKVNGYTPNARSSGPWNNYLDAADLGNHLHAYDACADVISAADKAAFLTKVKTHIAVMKGETAAPGGTGNITENVAAVLGMCGICFPEDPEAYDWLDHSLKFLQTAYQQMENQACIAEGPSYQAGFGIAAFTATIMMTLEEHGFAVVPSDNFAEEIYMFIVKTMRPDKHCVETEDCYQNTTIGSIWPAKYITSSTEHRRALQWYLKHIGGGGGVKNFLTWDTSLNETNPPGWNPTQFFQESSCAVFREGWGSTDTWLYFLGDRMPFFFSYAGMGGWIHNKNHGHDDATSITLHAHGQYLLTETARFRGLTAKYHNLIMVDMDDGEPSWGANSEADFTRMKNTFDTDFLDGADMEITYKNTDFVRSVLFLKELKTPADNEYFVIIDDVEAQDATDHQYDLQFHNKRGDITGSGLKKWTTATGSALAEIHFMEPDLTHVIRQQESVGDGSYASMDFVDHRILCRYTGQKFQFVTFLYPRTTSMASPTVTEINGTHYKGGKLAVSSSEDIILSQKGNQTETAGGIESNARQVVVRAVSGNTNMYLVKNGTILKRNGKTILSSDVPVKIAALEYTGATTISGAIHLESAANITFYSQDGNTSSWKFFDAGTYDPFTFTLASGGIVKGKVTDEDLGTGVARVKVEAIAGSEVSYCYTDANGNYTFQWVRPGATTIKFSRDGYTTKSVSGQNVVSGQTITLNQVLSITTANPTVTNAAVLKTTNTTAQIRVATNKPCYNQVVYGASTSYGSQTAKTSTYKEADTVTISGLTPGQLYHYKARAWDYDGRQGETADLQFVPVGDFTDDFEDGSYTAKWEPQTATWSESGGILKKTTAGNYAYDPKRLKDIILAKDVMYSSFTLTIDGRSLRASDKRDVCIVFNYEDDTHYYYAQFSMTTDMEYNGIFMVNGADKVKIGTAGDPTLAGDAWAKLKVVRDLKNGAIQCYADDMTTPCFTATDFNLGLGRIGLGSERSVVEYDNILIKPEAEGTPIVQPDAVFSSSLLEGLTITPNPVKAGRQLALDLELSKSSRARQVSINVTGLNGAVVNNLLDTYTAAEKIRLDWDQTNTNGRKVSRGVYLVRVQAGSGYAVRKLMLMD